MEVINKIYNYIRDFFMYLSCKNKPSYTNLSSNDDSEYVAINQMII